MQRDGELRQHISERGLSQLQHKRRDGDERPCYGEQDVRPIRDIQEAQLPDNNEVNQNRHQEGQGERTPHEK